MFRLCKEGHPRLALLGEVLLDEHIALKSPAPLFALSVQAVPPVVEITQSVGVAVRQRQPVPEPVQAIQSVRVGIELAEEVLQLVHAVLEVRLVGRFVGVFGPEDVVGVVEEAVDEVEHLSEVIQLRDVLFEGVGLQGQKLSEIHQSLFQRGLAGSQDDDG